MHVFISRFPYLRCPLYLRSSCPVPGLVATTLIDPISLSMISAIRKDRKSVFREVGLDLDNGDTMDLPKATPALEGRSEAVRTRLIPLDTSSVGRGVTKEAADDGGKATSDSTNEAHGTQPTCQTQHEGTPNSDESSTGSPTSKSPWYAKLATGRRPRVRTSSNSPPSAFQPLSTATMLVLAVAVMAPLVGRVNRETVGVADAGVVRIRADSPTDVCARWAQQSA